MKIFELIYFPGNDHIIQLFNPDFVQMNRNKYKIIYKNTIYPFQSEFISSQDIGPKLKIELICLCDFFNFNEMFRGCYTLYQLNEVKTNKGNSFNYVEYLKCSIYREIKIIYNIETNENIIRIFGSYFVNNNKEKCIIIYKDKIFPLKESFSIKDIDKEDKELEILLLEFENITDRSYMFHNCSLLKRFPEEEIKEIKNNENEVDLDYPEFDMYYSTIKTNNNSSTNLSSILADYSSLCFQIDKFKQSTDFICTDISFMFDGCSSLISLPDLSKWNIEKVKNLNFTFHGCSSLKYLPDISNWNTKNVTKMSYTFCNCSSLISLPDLSKWDTRNVTNMNGMFRGCSSLICLPKL